MAEDKHGDIEPRSHLFNETLNSSYYFDSFFMLHLGPPLWDTVVLGIIASLSLIGNTIVILLISFRKKLRKIASPNWFVLSLALADVCVGGLYAPSRFICTFSTDCSNLVWNIIYFFQSVFLSSSVTNLCVLTFDRYLAVVHPFTYQRVMNSSHVFHLIQLAWFMALLLNIPFLVTEFLPRVDLDIIVIHSVSHMVLFAFIPSVFMTYAYTTIVIIVRRHKSLIKRQEMQIAANFQKETRTNRHKKNHTKDGTMRAVGIIVLVFIVCSSLFQWLTICNLVESSDIAEDSPAYFIIFTLLHFKSAINVIVYALLRKDFQRELMSISRCFCVSRS